MQKLSGRIRVSWPSAGESHEELFPKSINMNETKFRHNERRHENQSGTESLRGPIIMHERQTNSKPPSLVVGESIKSHFESRYGDTCDLRGIKIVGHQEYSNEFVHRGKMFLAGKESQYTTFTPSVKQFHGTANLLSEPSTRISQHWTGKTRANPSESDLYEIETLMKRKLRLLSTEQQRNGIPISSHGDKYYKEADRERNFFKQGGLIPGSSIALRKPDKSEIRKRDDGGANSSITKPKLSFKEKQDKEYLENDLKQLRELNNSYERLGQEVPSWEKKTGFYLVKPEDENY